MHSYLRPPSYRTGARRDHIRRTRSKGPKRVRIARELVRNIYHARLGGPLLRLEEDGFILAALCALFLDTR